VRWCLVWQIASLSGVSLAQFLEKGTSDPSLLVSSVTEIITCSGVLLQQGLHLGFPVRGIEPFAELFRFCCISFERHVVSPWS